MPRFPYTAIGVAAAWACAGSFAQTSNADGSADVTLPTVKVQADSAKPNWQKMREKESRVRAKGAAADEATLDTSSSQHITVIDADELNQINALNTLDVLERVPGITVNRTGALDGTIVLRGQNSSGFRVPMFIDGDRFRGRPSFQFMMISPSELEQVEVIRGPASVRYGSDGLSGLVNFVSKKPKGTLDEQFRFQGGEADMTYRSNGNGLQSSVSVEGAGAGFDVRAYAMGRHSDNYDTPAGEVANSRYTTSGGGLALGYMPSANQRYELSYRYGNIRDGASNATTTDNNTSRRIPLTIHQVRLGYEGTFDDGPFRRIDASLYGNAFESMLETNTYTPSTSTRKRTVSNVRGPNIVGGRISFELPDNPYQLNTSFGVDFAHDHWLGTKALTETTNTATGASTSTGFVRNGREMTQSNVGAFVLSEWAATQRLKLTAGARYDYYLTDTEIAFLGSEDLRPLFEAARNTKTSALTGSIGSSYFVNDVVELTGSYGTGFHMPWHSEMFSSGWNGSSYTIPNPELKPEYSTTAELGTRLHLNQAYIDFTAYRSMYRNFMETVQSTYLGLPATQTRNVGKARVQGFEASAKWQANRHWNLHGSLAYVRGTNRLTDKPLAGLAPWSGSLGAQYVSPGDVWSLGGEVQFAKGQSRYNAKTEYPAGGYGVVNLYSQIQLDRLGWGSKNTQLALGVTNLFDKQYRSASTSSNMSYPQSLLNPLTAPGRSVNVTLRTKF